MQTPSGNTFGSDKKFAMDWASQRSAPMHPSSGSMVAKTLHELQIATLKASQTATVSQKPNLISLAYFSFHMFILSPVPEIRVELLRLDQGKNNSAGIFSQITHTQSPGFWDTVPGIPAHSPRDCQHAPNFSELIYLFIFSV